MIAQLNFSLTHLFLCSYEDKQLRNKQTGLVLTVPQLQTNELANQQYASGSGNQKFEYDTLKGL